MKTRAALAVAVLVALAGGGAGAQSSPAAKPAELKLTVALGPAFPLGAAGVRWAELLTERALGSFVVKPYPGATLAQRDAVQELRILQAGDADLGAGSALAWSDRVTPLAAIALPWLVPTASQLDAVVADPLVREHFAAALVPHGVVLVALAPLGHRVLATRRTPVRAPADLAEMRVRVPTTALVGESYAALGAKPGVLAFADAQAALAAGTLDAQDAPATALVAARSWGNGLAHVAQWGAFADAMVFVVRREVWDTWPEALRAAARETAAQAAREARSGPREAEALAELASNGVAVLRLTPAGHAAFRAAAGTVYDRWTPAIGVALVEAAVAASTRGKPSGIGAPGPAR